MSTISPAGTVTPDGLTVDVDDVRAVELRAAAAWPETSHQMLDGWRLRYSPGITNRRANSVLPLFPLKSITCDHAIEQVEAFYGAKGLPTRFMVSPACEPGTLDQFLAARGYVIDAPTDVQWANTPDVMVKGTAGFDISLSADPDLEWMSVYMDGTTESAEIETKMALIGRIPGNHVVARLRDKGAVVSVGLAVEEDGWAGIFCMHTLHHHRRRGYARGVLGRLADWADEQGAKQMYLQVERDNPAARTFYERSGFKTTYGYHYRTKES